MTAGEERGATGSNVMAHLALVVGDGTTWLESVTDGQYGADPAAVSGRSARPGL